MRPVPTFEIFYVSNMQKTFMKHHLTSVLFCVTLITFSCDDSEIEIPRSCDLRATVRDMSSLDGCGFIFELEDGTRLEPYRLAYCGTPPLPKEITEDPLFDFEFIDGKKVRINYELMPEMASACMLGSIVKITCLTEERMLSAEE